MSVFGLFRTISPILCCIFVENFNASIANRFSSDIRFEISTSPSGLQKTFLNPLSHTTIRFFMNFMFRFSIDFQPKAAPTLSVCLKSHPRREAVLAAQPTGLTNFNNKNGWNTFMCSSSTLMIKPSSAVHYPSKKWNTPVPLFPQKSPIFSRIDPLFNILLTKLPSSSNSVEIIFFFWQDFCKVMAL